MISKTISRFKAMILGLTIAVMPISHAMAEETKKVMCEENLASIQAKGNELGMTITVLTGEDLETFAQATGKPPQVKLAFATAYVVTHKSNSTMALLQLFDDVGCFVKSALIPLEQAQRALRAAGRGES